MEQIFTKPGIMEVPKLYIYIKKKQLRRHQGPFLGWEKILIKSLHWTSMENKDKQGQLFVLKGLKKRLGKEVT